MPQPLMRHASGRPGERREIVELGPWFHNLHLPDGSETAADHPLGDFPANKWAQLASWIPADLTGWTALDVGCNAGFYSFELARRGAHVVGIDVDPHFLEQARWARTQFGFDEAQVEFRLGQLYELGRSTECFDLVLFMGIFYHLRYPLLGLDIVAEKARRLLVFQTLMMPGTEVYADTGDREIDQRDAFLEPGWPKMAFIEGRFAGDPTNWWVPNHAGVEAMLRSTGLRIVGYPGHEIYICEPAPRPLPEAARWDRAELDAAIGRVREPHA